MGRSLDDVLDPGSELTAYVRQTYALAWAALPESMQETLAQRGVVYRQIGENETFRSVSPYLEQTSRHFYGGADFPDLKACYVSAERTIYVAAGVANVPLLIHESFHALDHALAPPDGSWNSDKDRILNAIAKTSALNAYSQRSTAEAFAEWGLAYSGSVKKSMPKPFDNTTREDLDILAPKARDYLDALMRSLELAHARHPNAFGRQSEFDITLEVVHRTRVAHHFGMSPDDVDIEELRPLVRELEEQRGFGFVIQPAIELSKVDHEPVVRLDDEVAGLTSGKEIPVPDILDPKLEAYLGTIANVIVHQRSLGDQESLVMTRARRDGIAAVILAMAPEIDRARLGAIKKPGIEGLHAFLADASLDKSLPDTARLTEAQRSLVEEIWNAGVEQAGRNVSLSDLRSAIDDAAKTLEPKFAEHEERLRRLGREIGEKMAHASVQRLDLQNVYDPSPIKTLAKLDLRLERDVERHIQQIARDEERGETMSTSEKAIKAVLEEAGSRLGSSHRDLRAFLVSTDRHPAGIGLDVGHFNHR